VIPEPGMSYKPTYDDHQDILGVALAKELVQIEKEKRLDARMPDLNKLPKGKIVKIERDMFATPKGQGPMEPLEEIPKPIVSAENRKSEKQRRKELQKKLKRIREMRNRRRKKRKNAAQR
jgi:nucleolar protein 53